MYPLVVLRVSTRPFLFVFFHIIYDTLLSLSKSGDDDFGVRPQPPARARWEFRGLPETF